MNELFTPADEQEQLALDLANKVVLDAILEQSSDIHLTPQRYDTVIRFRIDGRLREIARYSHDAMGALTRVLKKMGALDPDLTDMPQAGRMHLAAGRTAEDRKQYDLHVGTVPSYFGEAMTIRIQPTETEGGLDALGYDPADLERIRSLVRMPYGLVLFAGPTGSGKTVTIRACLRDMLKDDRLRDSCIMTLEDPVEAILDGAIQTAVRSDGEFNYARALKALVQHDLDVLYCADLEDAETAQLLVQTALTGHLVVSPLHACDAAEAVKRLGDLGVAPYLIGQALVGVVAQRLVRRLCDNCKVASSPPAGLNVTQAWQPAGCDECRQTGYRGLLPVVEILAGQDLRPHIFERVDLAVEAFRGALRQAGHRFLWDASLDCVQRGLTSVEEVLRTIPPPVS